MKFDSSMGNYDVGQDPDRASCQRSKQKEMAEAPEHVHIAPTDIIILL